MRQLILSVLVSGLIVSAAIADDAEARKVLEAAIKATGGTGQSQAVSWKGKGQSHATGEATDYTGTWSKQLPDKSRIEIENAVTTIVNGDKAWTSKAGNVREMTKDQLAEQREELHAEWVMSLHPLKDKAFTLSLVGESKLGDKPVIGVTVSHKGRRDVTLYFDKASHLLVKEEHVVKDELSGKDEIQETVITDWAMVGDTKVASKIVVKRDGRPYQNGEMSNYNIADKHPDGTFDKP